MYVIPLFIIVLAALSIFFSPVVAIMLLLVALIGIGAVKFFGGSTVDAESAAATAEASPAQSPGTHFTKDPDPEGEKTGLWGEGRPD
jgi:hypothetical protein